MLNSTRSQAVARIADRTASQHHRSREYLIAHMPFPIWLSFGTESLNPAVFEILRSKRIVVTSLTFQGNVTSLVTWPFDSPYAISYWWSFGTESLNPAVFEILRSKRIGVTSLTFQGNVTSSVTWPFDCPYAISYWWSFGTKPLSLTVSEVFNVECHAILIMTLIRPLNEGQGHSFYFIYFILFINFARSVIQYNSRNSTK